MPFGHAFLEYPDLFPGRPSGEPWGPEELHLGFPGCPVVVRGLTGRQAATLAEHFASVAGEPPAQLETSPTEMFVLRASSSDFRPEEDQGFELDLHYSERAVQIAGWHTMARFDWTPRPQAALWSPHEEGILFTSGFENVCRGLAAYALAARGGALVHSAAAGDGQTSDLFVGNSGAGKTTLWARLQAEGAAVLCDDLNAVSRRDGTLWVESTPFSTELSLRARAPVKSRLGSILFLEQGPTPSLEPISRAGATSRLFANTPFINRDPHRREALFDTIEQFCEDVPTAVLTVPDRPGLWGWLQALDR